MRPFYGLVIFSQICVCMCEDPRRKLLEDLIGEASNYTKQLTPVKDPTKVVVVNISLTPHQFRDLDERHQYLHIMTWLRLMWTDEYLSWNASDYGNVTRIHIPASDLWRPDIVLYNSVDEEKQATEIMPETNIQVWSDGRVKWAGPALLQSSCKIRIAEYPFDIQRCPLKFGSWTYNGAEVNVTSVETYASLDDFIPNEEWEVIEIPAKRHDVLYECCPESYPDITYTLVIKRKPMFYLFNLLFPCVLLMILGILVFCLPPESGEKVSMAITVLLAMSVYQLIIMENIPRTSDEIPVLNQYFSASIVMLSLSTILAVLVMNWHFDGIHGIRAPRWARVLVLGKLSRLLCLKKETSQTHVFEKTKHQTYENQIETEDGDMVNCNSNLSKIEDGDMVNCNSNLSKIEDGDMVNCNSNLSKIEDGDMVNCNSNLSKIEDGDMVNCNSNLSKIEDGDMVNCNSNLSKIEDGDMVNCNSNLSKTEDGDMVNCNLSNRPTPSTSIDHILEEIRDYKQNNDHSSKIESEWKRIALILDRLFLIIFIILTIAVTVGIFSKVVSFEGSR